MEGYSFLRRKIKYWYQRIFRPSSLQYEGPFNFFIIDDDPLIILTFTPCGLGHVRFMAKEVSPRPCHFLVGFWWSMKDIGRVDAFQRNWKSIKGEYSNIDIQVLCNTRKEKNIFDRRTKIDSHYVNQNCMLDEKMWNVEGVDSKKYDAIYNARVGRYKRIELSHKINNLAIITAPYDGKIEHDDYANELRKRMSHADWLNFEEEGYRRLSSTEVREHISHAHAGLALSGTEGACYAVGEYLLSGIPVVSTPSEGGRDVWFTPETCIIVDDTPEAVAEGVQTWKERSPDPRRIREVTIEKVKNHRRRLFGVVDKIRKNHGKNISFQEEWKNRSINKMRKICNKEEFIGIKSKDMFDKWVNN